MRRVALSALLLFWIQPCFASGLAFSPPPSGPPTQALNYLCGGYDGAHCSLRPSQRHHLAELEVWGYLELPLYATGVREAPNGVSFNPLFALNGSFNIGLLPDKKLYLFSKTSIWMQRPGAGITNSAQGNFDFSKREFDFDAGIAWNYYKSLEFRLSGYAMNNLNRGLSLATPAGFKDGVLIENRYYFGSADPYDIGRLDFLSLGYYPAKSMVGGNGEEFHPGLFARAHLSYGLPFWHSYLYGDASYTAQRAVVPRLLELNTGVALRPFERLQCLEFRVGSNLTADVHDRVTRDLIYGSVRLNY